MSNKKAPGSVNREQG